MSSSRRLCLSLCLLGVVTSPLAAPPPLPDGLRDDATAVMGALLAQGRVMQTVKALTEQHPQRMTGTAGFAAAADWAAVQLREAGLPRVTRESFTLANGWEARGASAALQEPRAQSLHVASVPWSPPTPAGGIEAELVALTAAESIEPFAFGERVRGRIVLLSPRVVLADMGRIGDGVQRVAALHSALQAGGARAVLWNSTQPNNVVKTMALLAPGSGRVVGLPAASLGLEDMLLLRRLLEQGPVRLRLTLDNVVSGAVTVDNVIGELPGRDAGPEWVLAGAHLDAWPGGSGANDNGVGVAAVIETARSLAALPERPRRTVRFALWAGEEQGLLGSSAFVRAHADELPHLVLALNHDMGAGKPKGWLTPGRDDLARAFGVAGRELLARLGALEIQAEFACHDDTVPFVLAGVPALNLAPDMTQYFDTHHLPADTYDKLDPLHVAADAALFASATLLAAELPQRLAPYREAAAVDAWIRQEGQQGCRRWITPVG